MKERKRMISEAARELGLETCAGIIAGLAGEG